MNGYLALLVGAGLSALIIYGYIWWDSHRNL